MPHMGVLKQPTKNCIALGTLDDAGRTFGVTRMTPTKK